MINSTNTVRLLIDKSPIAKLPPGRFIDWALTEDDLEPSTDVNVVQIELKVIVVLGNNQYRSGRRLTIYMKPDVTHLTPTT